MISLEPHADGVVLPVKAQPGSRHNGIRGLHGGALKVAVTQVAEKGKANRAILAVLAGQLGLKIHQLEILSGNTGSAKRILVRETEMGELQRRIEAVLGKP